MGKERDKTCQKLKRSPEERHTQTHRNFNTFKYHVFAPMGRFQLELIYLYLFIDGTTVENKGKLIPTQKLIRNISTVTDFFLNQKRMNVYEHTTK